MITGGSTLDPGFPTWGTMLREQGYRTYWYGKWHLTHGDNLWDSSEDFGALEPYGFTGGTYPSPDGAPGQGWRVDPHIVTQFEKWFPAAPKHEPWCTTVSFVNPHDIAWWYRWSQRFASEAQPPSIVGELPPNFETPEEMAAKHKPLLQRSLQDTAQLSFGTVPYGGPEVEQTWLPFMDLYLQLLGEVDAHIGAVLNTLASRPEVAANTVIVFTSDHGEYGASHGMRGKGASAYEEAIRVPLIVRDLRDASDHQGAGADANGPDLERRRGAAAARHREQAPLPGARQESYSQIASRHEVAQCWATPRRPDATTCCTPPTRPSPSSPSNRTPREAPLHVVALRTPAAKYATYSNFAPDSLKLLDAGRETELYDYSTAEGRMELQNLANDSALEPKLNAQLQRAIREELREPLPTRLYRAHKRGLLDYFNTAQAAALRATERRRETRRKRSRRGSPLRRRTGADDRCAPKRAPPSASASRRRLKRRGDRRLG